MKKKIVASSLIAALLMQSVAALPVSAESGAAALSYVYDDYEVTYNVTNSWGNTEVVSVTLTNTGDSTIENWMLYFEPNGNVQYVTDVTQIMTTDGNIYFRNNGYNANIAPDASVSFSYAVDDCDTAPESFTLCQTRASKESGYEVTLQVNQSWGNSFNGEIIIKNNTNAPIEAWELEFDTNFTITEITNSWAATVTELKPYSYLLKGTYTSTIPANSSVSLGFIGVMDGEPKVTNHSLTEIVVDEGIINSVINGSDEDVFYDDYFDWSTLPDSDGDGLPDKFENEYGCDPANPDTDDDGLPDGYEIVSVGSNPADKNSLDNTLSDGEYDSDQDDLSNYEEYLLGTDPLRADSDFDGLSDGDEVNVHGTDPLNPDTDGDGLSDGDEIALGLNPLVTDSNEDGVPDNEEKFSQSMTYDTEDSDTIIDSINVSFEGTGYINSTTEVESIMGTDWMCSNVVGLVGDSYDISSDSSFDSATITFTVDQSSLGDTQFENLAVLWYNEEEQRFVEMETIPNAENSTLTTTVEHFSKYLIVDCSRWYEAWSENNYPITGNSLKTAITIDCSSSMEGNDPYNYRITAANSFVDVMTAADLASVIFFADGADERQELTDDQEALKEAIDQVFSAGTTNYEAALRYSIDSLEKQPDSDADDIIIFLSDGRPTNVVEGVGIEIPEDEFDYSLVDEAASKGIRIYTIGLTNGVNEKILREMARRTNGEYYYANTAKDLISYFLTINMGKKYDITTDTDEDGIPDLFEIYGMPVANGRVLFSDPENKDTDGDGLEDGEEVIMHIVDDADEVKAAYNYMYDYIPDIFISDNGGIYFTMVADPENVDTDGDDITDGDEVKQIGEGGIAERYGIQSYDDYEYIIDPHYYDYENNVSLLDPLNEDTIESLYPELQLGNEKNNNNLDTNAIYYTIDGNEITMNVAMKFNVVCGEGKTLSDYPDRDIDALKNRIKTGIASNWGGEYSGTVYDFYPGLDINVVVNITEKNEGKVYTVNMNMESGRSYNGGRAASPTDTASMMLYYHGDIPYFGQVASHEFGHGLGLADMYSEDFCDREFLPKEGQSEIIGSKSMMISNQIVAANDIEMALYAIINDESQNYIPSVDRTISPAIRERQLYRYQLSVPGVYYDKKVDYICWNGKAYIPENSAVHTLKTESGEYVYAKETINSITTITILDFTDKSYEGTAVILDEINGYPVTKIGDGAFMEASINSVEFENPDNIIYLGKGAFYNCSNLENVTIPSNVKNIRYYTFQNCTNLASVNLPDVVRIETSAFYDCQNLTGITIPDGVKRIGNSAFYNCQNIGNVEIPASVEQIDAYAFNMCWWNNAGLVTFLRTSGMRYDSGMFLNCRNVTISVPETARTQYQNIFKGFSEDRIITFS